MNPISFSFPIYEEIPESVFIDMKNAEQEKETIIVSSQDDRAG